MSLRVLFVDDEHSVLRSLSRLFSIHYDLTVAYCADEGLRLLNHAPHFDVVVTDVRMPGTNGLDFIDQAAGRHPNTRFIVLTGNADEATLDRAAEMPTVSSVLLKPSNYQEIYEAIESAAASSPLAVS